MKSSIRKYKLLFGVCITIFIISSSTVTGNVHQILNQNNHNESPNESSNSNNSKEITGPNVSSNVIIKNSLLPKLKQAINKLGNEDEDYKIILQEIINRLQTQSSLDADDVRDILISLGMTNINVCVGKVEGAADSSDDLDPSASGFPFIPSFLMMAIFWIGPGVFVKWYAEGSVSITICKKNVEENHMGFALANVGIWAYLIIPHEYASPTYGIYLKFVSPLIIWEYL